MQNGLQLNPDKSEALIVGTSYQLKQISLAVPSVTITDVDLPVAEQMKVLGVVLDQQQTFEKHATAVAKSYVCNYQAQALRHIRHMLMSNLVQTLVCSLILSRLDYCNALVTRHSSRDDSQATAHAEQHRSRRSDDKTLLRRLHWLPVKHKTALLTFNV